MTDSSSARATLLVLYCARLEECRGFYGAVRLGFTVTGTAATPPLAPGSHRLTDPDGRTVEVHAT
jgi:hypothetical protein